VVDLKGEDVAAAVVEVLVVNASHNRVWDNRMEISAEVCPRCITPITYETSPSARKRLSLADRLEFLANLVRLLLPELPLLLQSLYQLLLSRHPLPLLPLPSRRSPSRHSPQPHLLRRSK